MIRTKGEAGTGNVVEAVRHARAVTGAIRALQTMDEDELYVLRERQSAPRSTWCARPAPDRSPPRRQLRGGRGRHARRTRP